MYMKRERKFLHLKMHLLPFYHFLDAHSLLPIYTFILVFEINFFLISSRIFGCKKGYAIMSRIMEENKFSCSLKVSPPPMIWIDPISYFSSLDMYTKSFLYIFLGMCFRHPINFSIYLRKVKLP